MPVGLCGSWRATAQGVGGIRNPRKGKGKVAVGKVCARWREVYNGIASTERVEIGQGGECGPFFCLLQEKVCWTTGMKGNGCS